MIPDMELTPSNDNDFALEHADLGVHNIFVDEDFNITCVIDWSQCSTVPLATLITHAPLPTRSNDVGEAEGQAFERGFEEEEMKRDSSGRLTVLLMESQAIVRRDFNRILHKDDSVADWSRFQRLFEWKYGSVDMKEYFGQRKKDRMAGEKLDV